MDALLQRVLSRFFPEGSVQSCSRYGCGHITETYLVVTRDGKRYILQRISSRASSRISPRSFFTESGDCA